MDEPDGLSDEVKIFIVQQLACFQTPSEVASAVKDNFEIVVTRQRVHRYDPTKKAGADLSEELRQIFHATRKELVEGHAKSAIEHRSVRLSWLNDMAITAKGRGNMMLAAQLIEQAAKETGGAFTNRHKHELTGKDGGPMISRIERVVIDSPSNSNGAGVPPAAATETVQRS